MKDGDIDAYVANFEQLARKAGYRLDTLQTIDIFTDGLPQELYAKVYQFDEPRNYKEWKNATIRRQEQYIHMKAKLDLHHPKNQLPRFPQQRGGWTPTRNLVPRFRDPNAMDTSADRARARLADAEEVLERYGRNNAGTYQAPRGQYPPRGGALGA